MSKKKATRWWLRGAMAFGGWLVLLWIAGLMLPEDGSFPWWYSVLMLPIYPSAALSAVILPEDTNSFALPALMMLLTLGFGAGVGWGAGRLLERRHKRHAH